MRTNTLLLARLAAALAGAGLLGLFSVALLPARAVAADLSVNIQVDAPPPPPRREVVVEAKRPGPDYIWIDGFWDGAPGHYVWVSGHWDRPPRRGVRWHAPHWERDHGGHYSLVRGEWR
jgi:hypothetical protein